MIVLLFVILAVCIVFFLYWQNNGIVTANFTFSNKKIPPAFDGFRIVQVSDLHNKMFGKDQSVLIQKMKDAKPDIIVVTGDLIDCHRPNVESAMAFIRKAVLIARVYYVPGNQEGRTSKYNDLFGKLKTAGVIILENTNAQQDRSGQSITVTGLRDIEFLKESKKSRPVNKFQQILAGLNGSATGFTILLSHRPEYLDVYSSGNFDLVFSGHAHGGQIRLPFLGGLYAPGQGWLPKYTAGLYQKNNTSMIVSRGLGNSEFPFRVFNRPELVAVTLKTDIHKT